MKPISFNTVALCFAVSCASCVQTPGEGGRASIVGHVVEEERLVLENPASVQGVYPATDQEVFLIYGDNVGPDDNVETNHEGNFVFPWLRPGDYTVYVYSEDTSGDPHARRGGGATRHHFLHQRDSDVGHFAHFQRPLNVAHVDPHGVCFGVGTGDARASSRLGSRPSVVGGVVHRPKPAS